MHRTGRGIHYHLVILSLLGSNNFNTYQSIPILPTSWEVSSINEMIYQLFFSSSLTFANIDKKDYLWMSSSTMAQIQCELRQYCPQKDIISITARDTICVSLHFFQCALTKASHQVGPPLSMHTLILPSAVPLHMLFPLPKVHCLPPSKARVSHNDHQLRSGI